MKALLYVGLGGALGAMGRVGLMRVLPSSLWNLPIKILLVNVIGCFIIGLLTESGAFFGNLPESVRHFLFQGFLGGFTTFSAFALEFGLLNGKGWTGLALLYVLLSVGLSLLFFFLGLKLVRIFV